VRITQLAGLPDAKIERTWQSASPKELDPANAATASSALPGQARLRAFMPTAVHLNKRLMESLREQEI
jgi:hypothetical protein